jgi:probable phosphoglycerate mutase
MGFWSTCCPSFGGLGTIYLLRHGETEWNAQGRKQGDLDSPLTARGREQVLGVAMRLAGRFDARDVTLFASSPLGRALATSRIVAAELAIDEGEVRSEPRLAEHHMGEWQGLTNPEIDARFGNARQQRDRDRWHFVIPGGESYERLHVRATEWLASVAGEPLVIAVGHEMINRTLLGACAGLGAEETLALRHPQDVVYRLSGGTFEALR